MKRTLNVWLNDYSTDHVNKQNQRIHMICVPAIFFTVVGALHLLPWGFELPWRLEMIHVGDIALLAALVWYATLGLKALGLMLAQVAAALLITTGLTSTLGTGPTTWLLAAIFVIAWCGQFYGHKLEGRSPSFFKDLQYLLIGPLWVWLGH